MKMTDRPATNARPAVATDGGEVVATEPVAPTVAGFGTGGAHAPAVLDGPPPVLVARDPQRGPAKRSQSLEPIVRGQDRNQLPSNADRVVGAPNRAPCLRALHRLIKRITRTHQL